MMQEMREFEVHLIEGEFEEAAACLKSLYAVQKHLHPDQVEGWRSPVLSFLKTLEHRHYPHLTQQQFFKGVSLKHTDILA